MDEQVWKSRFVEALCERFASRGLRKRDAHADAEVHADDCYPNRGAGTPEDEARALSSSLFSR